MELAVFNLSVYHDPLIECIKADTFQCDLILESTPFYLMKDSAVQLAHLNRCDAFGSGNTLTLWKNLYVERVWFFFKLW